jgi:cellulose synthase (UDP-forming)
MSVLRPGAGPSVSAAPPPPAAVPSGDLLSAPALDVEQLAEAVFTLSDGHVIGIPPSGPVFDRSRAAPRRLRRRTFVPVLGRTDRVLAAVLSTGWLVCLVLFWIWLLQPAHRISWLGIAVNGAILLYLSVMPVYFMVGVNRLKRVDPAIGIPRLRVAFAVTRAPSEPWDVARRTLEAMLTQRFPYPYDVWLCDESPTDEIRTWCDGNGVGVISRFEVAAYHRTIWPRRTRCKEGNLAFFYDQIGYRDYDVVAQLDCDHVPEPGYLAEMVRPFADEAIGYVAAPSVCDSNAELSWAARGRLHREATFHGPAQLGHSAGLAPVCIGSHYAVRTRALRDIGGIGPELAEDFSTSFLLNSAGWQGAFAIEAEAHGDGPLTFSAMLVQEFQWSRSLTTVLLGLVPRHLPRLPWKLRLRFLYALSYYVLLASTTVGGLALAPIAAVTGTPWINVNYLEFLLRWWSISVWVLALALLLRRRGMLRPRRAPIISWENNLYALTRWPLIAWGVSAAVIQRIRPRPITFKVTPKSVGGLEPLPLRLTLPYLATNVLLAAASLYAETYTRAAGYVFLCLLGATTYAVVGLLVPLLHAGESARATGTRLLTATNRTVAVPLLAAVFAAVPVAVAIARYPAYASAVFGW